MIRRSATPSLAPNLARAILVVVFGAYAVIAFLRMLFQGFGPPSRIVVSTAYLIPMLWLQLYVFGRPQVQFRRPVCTPRCYARPCSSTRQLLTAPPGSR